MRRLGIAARLPVTAIALLLVFAIASPARATDTTVAAGIEYTLPADLVLAGTDTFTAGDPAGARCTIHGAGHGITSSTTAGWTGQLGIRNCDVDGLGADGVAAIDVTGGDVTIQNNVFSKSGVIACGAAGASSITFQGNTITADSLVRTVKALNESEASFFGHGMSTGTKLFQGNHILKSFIAFDSTGGWLIGGDQPSQANVLVGIRAGMFFSVAGNMTVRGNYIRTQVNASDWNSVKDFTMTSVTDTVVEHNVLREGAWLADPDNSPIELRYNLVVSPYEHAWVQVRAAGGAKIHHNLLVATKEVGDQPAGGFGIIADSDPNATPATEIFNNTLDAGGVCNPGIGGAVVMDAGLASVRSNAFVGVRTNPLAGIALVALRTKDVMPPLPELLGYADYNLFYNPDSPIKTNYGVAVAGKTMRVDAGFAYHDVPVGGAPDMQVDPRFAGDPDFGGKVPRSFPFTDDQVLSGAVSVCQILAYYRRVYAPGAGSPLVDAGDPQEGAGNDVGAIGGGADNSLDLFGRLCDPADIGTPVRTADTFTCKAVPLTGGGNPGTGGTIGPPGNGVHCVCQAGAGQNAGAAWLAYAAAAGAALLTRARRPRRRR